MSSKAEKALADFARLLACDHDWKVVEDTPTLRHERCRKCKSVNIMSKVVFIVPKGAKLKWPAKTSKRAHQRASRPSVRLAVKRSPRTSPS